jgi:hypothetical protein
MEEGKVAPSSFQDRWERLTLETQAATLGSRSGHTKSQPRWVVWGETPSAVGFIF